MLKEQILNFTTILGCTLALGAFFDRVLIKDAQRNQISNLLQMPRGKVSFHDAFYRYIRLINDSVFNKFFSAPFFSWRYFLATSVLSTICLLLVVLTQFLLSPTNLKLLPNAPSETLALLVCFFSNLIIDWVSIGQTQVFFRISARLRSLKKSSLLIVSDLILTINFFILIISVVLAVFINLADKPVTTGRFEALSITSEVKQGEANFVPVGGPYFGHVTQSLYLLSGIDQARGMSGRITVFSDRNDVTLWEAINLAAPATGVRSWGYRNVLKPPEFLLKPVSKTLTSRAANGDIEKGSKDWQDLTSNYWRETPTLTVMAGNHPDGWNKNYAYTVGFKAASIVQQEFPEDVQAIMMPITVSSLLTTYSQNRSNVTWPLVYGCATRSADGVVQWHPSKSMAIFSQKCAKRATVVASDFNSFAAGMKNSVGGWSNVVVPINTLFMTSMIMTFVIYSFTLFLIVARFISGTFLAHLWLIEPAFAKAPLASAGVIIGLVLYIFTLI